MTRHSLGFALAATASLLACSTDDSSAPPPLLTVAPLGGSGGQPSAGSSGSSGTAGVGGASGEAGHAGHVTAGSGGTSGSGGASGGSAGDGGSAGASGASGSSGASAGAAGVGGAGGAPVECNVDPFSCGAGKTCWITDASTGDVACLESEKGRGKGACCNNVVGIPSCGDGLMCFGSGSQVSECIPFCDDAHPCDAGETCTSVNYFPGSPVLHVCKPATWPTSCTP